LILGVSTSLVGLAQPVAAQDLLGGLFRFLFQPSARVAPSPPSHYRLAPNYDRRANLRRPKVVRSEESAVKAPLKARAIGEMTNPLPTLLADRTLRRGDIVMFPHGPRVFVGQSGTQHTIEDFEPVSSNNKAVPQGTRKLLANLHPGWNGAWSAEKPSDTARLATTDVLTTGSVTPRRR
jgi:hypothetical protein